MEFQAFNLHPNVAAGVTAAGFITPTPIQAQAIPSVMQGRDVMGLAQTGTGKTAAFALPILHRLMQGGRGHVRALIVAPTRELAEQIHEAIGILGRQTRLRSVTVYGGVSFNPQVEKLRRGAEIIVACPGRLLDHISQRTVDLSRMEVLVLDEADHMFDMGFLPDIRRILNHIPKQRQTLLFSATMPPEIRHLANDVLNNPMTLQVDVSAAAVTVSHALYPVAQHLKTPLLIELLRHTDTESVLIFTRTKHRAKRLGEQLAKTGYRTASLQGNLSQARRQAAMKGFRDGTFQILVATDIAARGIDVTQISHVINYDIPNTTDAYIHRIGRTGRAARSGDAYTFVATEDMDTVRDIEYVLGGPIERRKVDGFDYGVAAPRKDSEFARPPRPSVHYGKPNGERKNGRQGASFAGRYR
jgi:ATP-dependent RNA helicase RhlE